MAARGSPLMVTNILCAFVCAMELASDTFGTALLCCACFGGFFRKKTVGVSL